VQQTHTQTRSEKAKTGNKTMNEKNNRCIMNFNVASLCFGRTKTLLCEAKHPVGLHKTVK
jgi:hypothetical protein